MNIKPIPKHLLIHSVKYREKLPNGRYQNDEFGEPIDINHVRVVMSSKVITINDNENKLTKGSMFICATNTEPLINPVVKSEIVFNGQTMVVDEVIPVEHTELHHYEVILT